MTGRWSWAAITTSRIPLDAGHRPRVARAPANGRAVAGSAGVSADGTQIGYSIGSLGQFVWDPGPLDAGLRVAGVDAPPPPDGGTVDGKLRSAGTISGRWEHGRRPLLATGTGLNRAHASKWTQATGVVGPGRNHRGQASRANGVNHNASVIVGWVETPDRTHGAAAWVNGSLVLLTNYDDSAVVPHWKWRGQGDLFERRHRRDFSTDPDFHQRAASMWKAHRWRSSRSDGAPGLGGWHRARVTPFRAAGSSIPWAVSDDGGIVVGYCSFDGSPRQATTGFVWTQNTGVVDVNQFLQDQRRADRSPASPIQSLTAMTPDGTKIFGYGQMLTRQAHPQGIQRSACSEDGRSFAAPAGRADRTLSSAPRPNPSSIRPFSHGSHAAEHAAALESLGLRRVQGGTSRPCCTQPNCPPVGKSVAWDGRDANGRVPGYPASTLRRLVAPQGSAIRRIVRAD